MEVKISLCQKTAKWQPEANCLQDMNSKKNIYSNVLCPQIKSIFIQFFSHSNFISKLHNYILHPILIGAGATI